MLEELQVEVTDCSNVPFSDADRTSTPAWLIRLACAAHAAAASLAECRDLCEWFGVSRTRAAIHHWYQSYADHYDQDFTADLDRIAVDEKQIQLAERIDTDLVASVCDLSIASEWADPVFAVGLDVLQKIRAVGKPRVEAVGFRRNTYLFIEFCDDLAGEVVFCIVVFVFFALLFVEAESERISGLIVGVECVDDILGLDSVAFSVIVEAADAGDFVPGFLGDRVVKDDVAVL
jgi:hypothetical protein